MPDGAELIVFVDATSSVDNDSIEGAEASSTLTIIGEGSQNFSTTQVDFDGTVVLSPIPSRFKVGTGSEGRAGSVHIVAAGASLSLPTAASSYGEIIIVKNNSSDDDEIVVTTSDDVDGGSSISLAGPYVAGIFYSNGIDWHLISGTATLHQPQVFTKAQATKRFVLDNALTTVPVDASESNVFDLTLNAASMTLANPSNLADGGEYTFIIRQDGAGNRVLAFGPNYQFPGGVAPTITTAINSVDIITAVSDGTLLYCTYSQAFS